MASVGWDWTAVKRWLREYWMVVFACTVIVGVGVFTGLVCYELSRSDYHI